MGVDGPAEQKPVCSVRYGPMQTAATATTVFSHKLRNPPTPKFGGFLPSEIWGFLQFGLSVQGRLQAFLSWSPEPVLDHATPPLPSPPFVLQCAVRRPRYGAATVPSAETRPGGGTSPTRAAGSKAWSNQYFHPHETSRHRSKRVLQTRAARRTRTGAPTARTRTGAARRTRTGAPTPTTRTGAARRTRTGAPVPRATTWTIA